MFPKAFLRTIRARRFVSAVIAFCAIGATMLAALQPSPLLADPGTVNVRVYPAIQAASVNGTFTVNVVADVGTEMDPNGLGAYEFDLVYDRDYVEVITDGAQDAGELGETGRTVIELGPNVDNDNGRTTFAAYSHPPQDVDGPNDTVVLATVTLRAKQTGLTTVNLENALLTDTEANAWPNVGAGHDLNVVGGSVMMMSGDTGDFDGDKTDAIVVGRAGPDDSLIWRVALSDGSEFGEPYVRRAFAKGTDIPLVGDFDGDGKTDAAFVRAIASNQLRWYVALSDGSKFGSPSPWRLRMGPQDENDLPLAGDFDGDGKDDAIIVDRAGPDDSLIWRVALSDGSEFGEPYVRRAFAKGTDIPLVGDFNGDGKTDAAFVRAIASNQLRWYVALSDGSKFGSPSPWCLRMGPQDENDLPLAGDFDGDGKDDAIVVGRAGPDDSLIWRVALSDGSEFGEPYVRRAFAKGTDIPLVGDFNGDGKTDAAFVRAIASNQLRWYVALSDGSKFGSPSPWRLRMGPQDENDIVMGAR